LALSPASNLKLITTAAGLETLGKNYRFKTYLAYDGHIDFDKKILFGNLIIKGGGDPTLGSKYFSETQDAAFFNQWAEFLRTTGIDSVSGRIYADTRCFDDENVPPTWAWEDMANYFGSGASGIAIYDNAYSMFFNTGINRGDSNTLTKVQPEIPGFILDNRSKADTIDFDNSFIFGSPYQNNREMRGELPKNRKNFEVRGALPNPGFQTAYDFAKLLKVYGIKINPVPIVIKNNKSKEIYDTASIQILLYTKSPELKDIIEKTNLNSINLFAEHIFNQMDVATGGNGSTKSAAAKLTKFWSDKGMDTDGLSINDGCGLSRYNTVTAKQMVFMLDYMKNKSQNFADFYESLPIAGEKGTIWSMCVGTSAAGNLHAKSGSIRAVRAYSGYVKSKSGRELAFSVLINNYNGMPVPAVKKIEKLLVSLSDFKD
jgi:D-alanyl-D-alanine carboxypeptidase/D-alanyl-D-alanine-endopeptidase (penicillin-binding protein 4)